MKKSFGETKPSLFQKKKKNPVTGMKTSEGGRPDFPVRKLTPAELQKRREQGLCFHYDERYTFNHKCKKLFWIEIEDGNEQGSTEEAAEEEQSEDKPEIFLNALVGMSTPQMMRVSATIGKFPLTTLIDTGSTHNFLHKSFAKLASLYTETNSSLLVVVANGEKLRSHGLCREVTLNL